MAQFSDQLRNRLGIHAVILAYYLSQSCAQVWDMKASKSEPSTSIGWPVCWIHIQHDKVQTIITLLCDCLSCLTYDDSAILGEKPRRSNTQLSRLSCPHQSRAAAHHAHRCEGAVEGNERRQQQPAIVSLLCLSRAEAQLSAVLMSIEGPTRAMARAADAARCPSRSRAHCTGCCVRPPLPRAVDRLDTCAAVPAAAVSASAALAASQALGVPECQLLWQKGIRPRLRRKALLLRQRLWRSSSGWRSRVLALLRRHYAQDRL